jgi:5'-nucleotidase
MRVEYDDSLPAMQRIVAATVGGQPLEAEHEYIVGTIDMFTFGSGYLSLKNGTEVNYLLPEFLRDILAAELKDEAAVQSSIVNRNWIQRNV